MNHGAGGRGEEESATRSEPPVLLQLRRITKRFPGAVALDDVSLELHAGRVHALLGENGAGKTTLVRVAFGMIQPDEGQILIDGRRVHLRMPAEAIRLGLGMVHQHFTSVPQLSVVENVALGGRGLLDRGAIAARIHAIGRDTGLAIDPDAPAHALPVTAQARLEVVKALVHGARVLMLDEPTALLAPREINDLLASLRRIAETGTAILLITHKLREALDTADEITVLRAGRVVLHASPSTTSMTELAAAMFGDDRLHAALATGAAAPAATIHPTSRPAAEPVVTAERLTVRDERGAVRLRDVDLVLHAGEIVGVAGVEGSGHRELLRAIAGRARHEGRLRISGDIGFIAEDRLRESLLPQRSLVENVALRDAGRQRGLMPWRAIAERTRQLMRRHDVRAPGAGVAAATLSGGNQQKLVLARELDGNPAIVVAENPSRGLDVGAMKAVHASLREARDRGAVVLVHSSDLDELLTLCDRMLVTHGSRVRELPLDRRAIGEAMLGA